MSGAYYNEIDPHCAQWLRNLIKAGEIAPGDVDERDIRDVTPGELVEYSQCHFFAGIGGWARALRLAGWPDDRPVWTGSCPCQSFSAAGRGRGFADERHLWPYWFHLIRICRPSTIFGEQVASKLALSWLDLVQDDLEGEGYAVGSADLCAAGVGAFHIRQRLWFVGYAQGYDKCRSSIPAMHREGVEVGGSSGPCALANPDPPGCDRRPPDTRQEMGIGAGKPSDCEVDPLADPQVIGSRAGLCDSGSGEIGRDEFADHGGYGGLANAHERPGFGSEPRPEFRAVPAADGGVCAVADSLIPRIGGGNQRGFGEERGKVAESENGTGVANEPCDRSEDADRLADAESRGALPAEQPESGDGFEQGGERNFWSDAIWLPCQDGKYRPAKSGILPLVARVSADMGSDCPGEISPYRVITDPKTGKSIGQAPWRIGMLKGAGNSIVPEVAAEFIRAYVSPPNTP